MTPILIFAIRCYQRLISPLISTLLGSPQCRFMPSCSQYAIDALQQHGTLTGTRLAIKRIARCHPLTKPHNQYLYDPLPTHKEHNKKP
ncbi:MAG: membrane protein insertion efficiency factor YidD [Alphaproteobacteria bacterium GM202ARS2]|nr:membrane protein insertion efficiency factor YidD [Alphaproteobacteria bacterium GM202ARS2]